MEEQLLQTEKLRALGEMANGVAHDFNNTLAVILGNTQLLLYTAKDEEAKGNSSDDREGVRGCCSDRATSSGLYKEESSAGTL